MYIQCMFQYILSSVVLITAKSCICEIKKHVTHEMLICVVGSRFNIMNKQPSFFIKKWKYIQWMYIFCCYQQSHLWVEKNNLIKCFVFPSRNLFMLLVYLHPAHIDVQWYRVGFQLVYLIQWQVRIMTGRRKKAVHKYYGRIYCHLDIGFCTKSLVSPWTIWSPVSNSRTCKLVSM